MNKYTELLEKHVQWVALGIGGLWLLFMVWTYVIQAESSTIVVGGQTLKAANVDKHIYDSKAVPLQERVINAGKLPELKEDYRKAIENELSLPPDNMPQLAQVWIRTPAGAKVGPTTEDDPTRKPIAKIKELPKFAKPAGVDYSYGRSVVGIVPPGGASPAVPTMVSWVTVAGTVPMQALAKEFNRVITTPEHQLHQTSLLRVDLYREELLPNGQWTKPVLVPWQNLGPNAAPPPIWPANNQTAQLQFLTAIAPVQKTLAQPDFFSPVQRGDQWHLPGQPAGQVGGPHAVPGAVPPPDLNTEPMPERPRVPGSVRPGIPPGPRPRPGTGRDRSGAAPSYPANVIPVAQVFEEPQPYPMPAPGNPAAMAPPGGAAAMPPANLPGQVPLGQFDPANANDFPIWVHDVTVQPGKTYRYRLRYTMKNPVFTANAACDPPKLGDEFAINSEVSEPTKPISIPNTVMIFAVQVSNIGGGQIIRDVTFDVFTWSVNGLTRKSVTAVAGDMIDDTLKVTLVDIRDRGNTVIIMDEHGTISTRSVPVDIKSKEYEDAKKTAAEPVAPLAGG